MARENQGLHIALIIFVMLTVILGVTTFFFVREYQAATIRANEAESKQTEAEQAARNIQDEANTLKQHIGWSASDKLPDITQAFNTDMDTYAVDDNERTYRKVVANLARSLQTAHAQLADALAKNQQWEATVTRIQGPANQQVATYKSNMDKMQQDLNNERTTFKQQRDDFTRKADQLQSVLAKAQQRLQQDLDDLKQRLAKADQQIRETQTALDTKNKIIKDMREPQLDMADGKVRWINQRERTVWINLGRADNLPNLTTFAVYDAEINDITTANKKADVQVIQLLGEHLAEARIIEDDLSDPIMPGDIIHTPIWAPGQQEHFALTDALDIDGDGKSDVHVIRNLITMAGGLIDAELDDTGKLSGKMDGNTRYLVIGTQHDETTPEEVRNARKGLLDKAEELGVRTISLADFLRKTGWREETPVVTYGRGANPEDFRAKPPEGVPRRSTGNVFRPRTPPRSTRRSAF